MRSILLLYLSMLSLPIYSQVNIDDVDGQVIYLEDYGGYLDVFDSGGEFGDYDNNENFHVTVCTERVYSGCPAVPGISLSITDFAVEGDGTFNCGFDRFGVSYESYTDYYCDSNLPPFYNFGLAGASDNDGCLTIYFESDASVVRSGFRASFQPQYPYNTYAVDLYCDDYYDNQYISIFSEPCYSCINRYECPQGVFHEGYYGLEERYYLSNSVNEEVTIHFWGDQDVDCFVYGYSNNQPWCGQVPIACAIGADQELTFDASAYHDINIYFDAPYTGSYSFRIDCLDPCERAYAPYCDEYFADSNDPFSPLAPYTRPSDFLDYHYDCTYDGCRFKTFDGAEFRNPEVVYSLYQLYGNITVDLKPASPNLDVDLFIYDGCTYNPEGGNNRTPETIMECEYSSTESPNKTDAIFIEDIYNNGNLYAVVDGQSNGGAANNVGDYIIGFTCGYLYDHNPTPLNCGEWFQANNIQGFNFASYYCCDPSDNKGGNFGPEQVYSFYLDQTEEVTITLDIQENKDLNLYLLNTLDVYSCLEYSKTGGSDDESITATLNAGTYYIVVEGYCGDYSDYRIKVDGCGYACSNCSWCFDYYWVEGIEGGEDYYHFKNNFCHQDEANYDGNFASYQWSFPTGAVDTYLEGTSSSSYEPKCRLNPGRWEVCYTVSYPGGSYTCCLWVIVPPNRCYSPPPTCGLSYTEDSPGQFTFDASTSEAAEAFAWVVEDAETKDTINIASSNTYQQGLDLSMYPGRCFIVSCFVSNCYGVSKVSILVCIDYPQCDTSEPGGPYYIYPVTDGDELYFDGVPEGFDAYEWEIPDELNFIDGDASSRSWRCGIPAGRTFKICLVLRKGCYVYCYCWYVRRGCCPYTPCDAWDLYCDEYISDDNLSLNAAYKSDRISTYHQHGCFEFKTNNGQPFTPLFNSIESKYTFTQPDLLTRPITIDVFNIDKGTFDPDIFLFEECYGASPRKCLDYSGHLPPPYNESVFVPAQAFQDFNQIYMVVDGQSFSNGAVNQGRYTIGVTCGPIDGGVHGFVPIEDIECETTFFGNTSEAGYGNHASYYACDPESNRGNNWGKEVIHRIDIEATNLYQIELNFNPNIDLNLYLLSDLDVQSCVDLSKSQAGSQELISTILDPGTYYVIVDGFAGDEGAYSLNVSGCTSSDDCVMDIGEVCGSAGSTIEVEVRANNFEEVLAFGFEIKHDSPDIRFGSITSEHPQLEGLISSSNVVNDRRMIVGWFSPDGDPVSIDDDEVVFTFSVEILRDFDPAVSLYDENKELESLGNSGYQVLHGEVCISENGSISGRVHTPSNKPKVNQQVVLSGPVSQSTTTDANGNYTFSDVPNGMYTISCYDNNNLKEGVSISDVGVLRRHYLEKNQIDDDYKLFAGDVNRNGSISISDVGLALRIYLEKVTQLANNNSWRFVPANQDISPAPMDPNRSEVMTINVNGNMTDADMIAVKVGDVNGTVNRLLEGSQQKQRVIDLDLTMIDTTIRRRDLARIPVLASMDSDLGLLGMSIQFDPNMLTINGIVPAALEGLSLANYNILEDKVLIGWEEANGEGIVPAHDTLFFLEVTVGNTLGSTALSFSNVEILNGDFESYNVVTSSSTITIDRALSNEELENHTLEIFPNPFQNRLSLKLDDTWNDEELLIRIYSLDGKQVYQSNRRGHTGRIDLSVDVEAGMYILEVLGGGRSMQKPIVKM